MAAEAIYEEILNLPVEKRGEALEAILPELNEEIREELALLAHRDFLEAKAREDNIEGFAAFYERIFEREPPEHVLGWIQKIGEADEQDKYLLIEAFRGASKSTTFIAYLAWRVGIDPVRSNLVIGAGDADAEKITSQVADIISRNEGWKAIFPHIEPDPDVQWGAGSGYEVKNTDYPYEEWRKLRQADGKDRTFIGVGYKSKYIPGPHPTGVLLVDDIHNEENTLSERELQKVKSIYDGTIIPMIEPTTKHVVIGTPWNYSDLIAQCRGSDQYVKVFTPVYDKETGEPTWPDKWDRDRIEKRRAEVSSNIEFARMYELDLEKTKGLVLKRKWLTPTFPHEKINENWPVFLGVDFTSTEDPLKQSGDYFTIAVARGIPGGQGIVIEDGLRERVSQAEAETALVAWATKYPTLSRVGIEAIITGKMFYNSILNNADIRAAGTPIVPLMGGEFQKSKGYRYEKIMAPLFQRNRVYLSDNAESQFLKHFRDEWMNWQGDRLESQYHNDTLDAVFGAIKAAEGFVAPVSKRQRSKQNPMWPTERKPNPIAAFGRK